MPWLIVRHIVFRSLLKIFVQCAAKQACKQLQCNKAKLLEPASINGLHNTRVYATASLVSAYTNENLGGHIYTVTQQKVQQPADKPATFSHVQTTMPLNIKKHHGKP